MSGSIWVFCMPGIIGSQNPSARLFKFAGTIVWTSVFRSSCCQVLPSFADQAFAKFCELAAMFFIQSVGRHRPSAEEITGSNVSRCRSRHNIGSRCHHIGIRIPHAQFFGVFQIAELPTRNLVQSITWFGWTRSTASSCSWSSS